MSILVTWDVVNLDTPIPHNLGIKACRRLLIHSRKYTSTHINFLIQLFLIILEENIFLFKEKYYLLLLIGVAMGSNVAPLYANAFMYMIENAFIYHLICLFKTVPVGTDLLMTPLQYGRAT